MTIRTPLYDLEAGRGARFAEYHSWEIAQDYGDPRAEYRAVRESAGVFDVCYTGKLRVSGRDRVRYLHNMLSNDIKNLARGKGCYATLLTHQGRMESDIFVYAFEEEIRLECSPAGRSRLFDTLSKFIVADKVIIEDCTQRFGILSIQGPDSRKRIEELLGLSLDLHGALDHQPLKQPSGDWAIVHRDRTGCEGYDLWAPVADFPDLWQKCVASLRIAPAGHTALNWLRTEAGIPWYGVDMDDKTLPMEMGLVDALSMTKGCYRGQEIVARVMHRGHLDRSLGAVAVEHAELPSAGAVIQSGGKKIGEVTSSILSPRLGKPLALAILKTEFLIPGTHVEVMQSGSAAAGEVVKVPLA